MDGADRRAERLRSLLVGGVIGASAVIATARRKRRVRNHAQQAHASGLAAFEDAPCHQETIERDAQSARGNTR